jgi:hypothetical protein
MKWYGWSFCIPGHFAFGLTLIIYLCSSTTRGCYVRSFDTARPRSWIHINRRIKLNATSIDCTPTDSQWIASLSKVYAETNNSFWPSMWIPTMIFDYIVLLKLASLPVDMLVLAPSSPHLHLLALVCCDTYANHHQIVCICSSRQDHRL